MPTTSTDFALTLAEQLYGLAGSATPLPGEVDANFKITTHDQQTFLLKISSTSDVGLLELQNNILNHLATTETSFRTPQLQKSTSGHWMTSIDTAEGPRHVRLYNFISGNLFAHSYHSNPLLESLGDQLGALAQCLKSFTHPAARREMKWDLKQAGWIKAHVNLISDLEKQALLIFFINRFETEVITPLYELPHSIIHGDINDYNVLIQNEKVHAFIDFGDVIETATICELAIACAYAALDKADPIDACNQIIRGFHVQHPLEDSELKLLYDLIAIRLCISVVNSHLRAMREPNNIYLRVSENGAWELLKKFRSIHPRYAHYAFRDACGLEACPQTLKIRQFLSQTPCESIIQPPIATLKAAALDLSPASLQVENFNDVIAQMQAQQIELPVGRYNEPRLIYNNDQYRVAANAGSLTRTIHLGLDLFLSADTEISAPLDGIIHSFADNNEDQDYGPTIILQHEIPTTSIHFYTLYGHLSRESLKEIKIGDRIKKGNRFATIGKQEENGGWIPHLHFQLITDLFDYSGNFPGVASATHRKLWLSICPDPNLITRINPEVFNNNKKNKQDILRAREHYFANNLSLAYTEPLEIVRGKAQYLYDETGRPYLDLVNNVCHVGHCHPHVVKAGQEQLALLNTNTRYLHHQLVTYAERLVRTLPKPLEVCFFVCSGSEANELALRLARTYTKRKAMLVMDNAYHGNTTSLIELSPYKFNHQGGEGKPDYVDVIPMPDQLRDKHLLPPQLTKSYAAFIIEPLLSCGGQIVLPENYLQSIFAAVRAGGGVCIADEIQIGLGRLGEKFWGFETQQVIPDIVTMGKPLGNGHPIGAVVTTREIADAFCKGMEYFNTFGGNPVSCAIGTAVLEVIEDENLQRQAYETGEYLKQKLTLLKNNYSCIADVRGKGLFLGIEFVSDEQLTPATQLTKIIVNKLKENGILVSSDGPFENVIKIKPPLVITKNNCDEFVMSLEKVLQKRY